MYSLSPNFRRLTLLLLRLTTSLTLLLVCGILCADDTLVSKGPDKEWQKRPTRTLQDLPRIRLDKKLGTFGGLTISKPLENGFFRTVHKNDRWWLVDPEGLPYIHRGVTSIRQTRTQQATKVLKKKFQDQSGWAQATTSLLKENGFNSIGPWSDDKTLEPGKHQLAYTKIWNFMSGYGKKRGDAFQASGHTGYPNDCPFFFDPEFADYCQERAQQLAPAKDDPWLLGHFTDNELPWRLEMLDRYLELPKEDHGYLAAADWLRQRYNRNKLPKKWNDEDRLAFVGFAANTYFSTVAQAIRKHDPNHLILGSRFHGRALQLSSLFEAAGKHCDVISVNYYNRWSPEKSRMAGWAQAANKPIVITEWYAKAVDSGMGNTSGAGWLVKTQKDRGRFYENFTLGLLESQVCVGWHWFRYSDNDPDQKGTDPSNRDANKGIVTSHYEPYAPLLESMKTINGRSYNLIKHFDKNNRPAKRSSKKK